MVQLEIWIYPNCMASAVCSLIEVLRVANLLAQTEMKMAGPLFSWSLRSYQGLNSLSAAGLSLSADAAISASSTPDVIVLPGVFLEHGVKGWLAQLRRQPEFLAILRQQHQRGCLLASNCSASFILAEAGLLDGQCATTSWWLERSFRGRYPAVDLQIDQILCQAPGIITGAAASAHLDLTLYLLQRYASPELAAKVARKLLIESHSHSQSPHREPTSEAEQHRSSLIRRSHQWILSHYQQSLRLSDLAEHLAVSQRTLIRHFQLHLQTTPAHYAQQVKMQMARQLLSHSAINIEQLAQRLGYADSNAFRRAFRRVCGLTTGQYRQQFSTAKPSETSSAVGAAGIDQVETAGN